MASQDDELKSLAIFAFALVCLLVLAVGCDPCILIYGFRLMVDGRVDLLVPPLNMSPGSHARSCCRLLGICTRYSEVRTSPPAAIRRVRLSACRAVGDGSPQESIRLA
ncbi:hypothetical protein M407DRAFT_96213 [Tulasnella calospora MUT 4182]|uniref:Uncharacterized protein n=1 Tax=Tulasnella calospora MUT 4182 TaxID=1051891 RepID=A0A0C3QVU3_9AGAM|nr:hypothetical protein M407DRAFT_96213 [Tulasnella calospora MUT 4182]